MYHIEDRLFTLRGSVFIGSMRDAQALAIRINDLRKSTGAKPIGAAELYAAGILHEVYHYIFDEYRRTANPTAFAKCEFELRKALDNDAVEQFLETFVDIFPPVSVYRGEQTPRQYLQDRNAPVVHSHEALEELILVWIENRNPALKPFGEIIGDGDLKNTQQYAPAVTSIDAFFDTQPPLPGEKLPLIKMFLQPILQSPESLMGQLEYIRINWERYLANTPIFRSLLSAQDFIREEGKYFAMMADADADRARQMQVKNPDFWGAGDKESHVFTMHGTGYEFEPERFSHDLNWMPRLVLIAKTTYVWLDQLSKKYGRDIYRLDQIPDEELDILAHRGFTGLWLIGIWARSEASRRIKHLHGNIDAVASAYSLYDYSIAYDLGGDEAYANLRDRAAMRGIKLASDMVPNHMGMDSQWMIQHPEWFIQSDWSPFPNYRFDGPDLSSDDRVGIFIEDGYWRKSDAAVVFKRLDRWTGNVRYVYHGNDGTNMAWNDTAQLDFTRADVREAVIQTILHVARQFPIIRFDAAMILAKKSFQRLWFPLPGQGGAIPSRAQYSMTKEQFDAMIPTEFWREVVDRVQREVPDTLLLAEAFWMMEGYFVRTLGMHRVYNSAFMNMLKKEENANYRTTIKNTLEYNPQILKRFVNFMNNPDEETAVAQFGKDDKYFGVCILMSTMPGLPMFGHGQVEGFTEKYGMEYRRAYYNETPDEHLVHRHEREIFPILKKRYLFSDVEQFHLYDLVQNDGYVNEDVFAYSNRFGDERGLVIYNNRFSHAQGRLRHSVPYLHEGNMIRKTFAEGLGLGGDWATFTIFRDAITGLEYIHRNRSLMDDGLFVELQAFKYHVFLDFREVQPTWNRPYDRLERMLGGRGVPSIEDELADLHLEPIHNAFRELVDPDHLRELMVIAKEDKPGAAQVMMAEFREKMSALTGAVHSVENSGGVTTGVVEDVMDELASLAGLSSAVSEKAYGEPDWQELLRRMIPANGDGRGYRADMEGWRVLLVWLIGHRLHALVPGHQQMKRNIVRDWRLEKLIAHSFTHLGLDNARAWHDAGLVRLLIDPAIDERIRSEATILDNLDRWILHEPVRWFIGANRYHGVEYFNKEKFTEFVDWVFVLRTLNAITLAAKSPETDADEALALAMTGDWEDSRLALARAEEAGYVVENFITLNAPVKTAIAPPPVAAPAARVSSAKKEPVKASKKTPARRTATAAKKVADKKAKPANEKKRL